MRIFPFIFLSACAAPIPDAGYPGHPDPRLKAQMPFFVDGVSYPTGFGVLERKPVSKVSVKLPEKTRIFLINSCARQNEFWNPNTKKSFEFLYQPAADFENKGICPVYLTAVTTDGEFHRSILGFANEPAYPAQVDVMCNANWELNIRSGSYMCHLADGLPIGIRSQKRAVLVKAPSADHCQEPLVDTSTAQDKGWVIFAKAPDSLKKPGVCVYVLKNESKEEFAISVHPYTSILRVFPPAK
jgi:hypothetical protein